MVLSGVQEMIKFIHVVNDLRMILQHGKSVGDGGWEFIVPREKLEKLLSNVNQMSLDTPWEGTLDITLPSASDTVSNDPLIRRNERAERAVKSIVALKLRHDALDAACTHFVHKVETGLARSVESYAQMKDALGLPLKGK
jgi:hypothetical protein